VGADWPHTEKRLAMLEEAVGIIRRLFTGAVVSHSGRYYDVDTARLYTLPDRPPEVYVSAFGPKALETAVRIGDGFVTTTPDDDGVAGFRAARGPDAPAVAAFKVAYAPTREEAVDHAHRLWSTSGLPGELAQVLPTPEHFEQAASLVTREATASSVTAGKDVRDHLAAFEPYRNAGFSTVYVANMGPHYKDMIRFYGQQVLPELRRRDA
jgi:G6PDH family F420-dependent oxidoreductase